MNHSKNDLSNAWDVSVIIPVFNTERTLEKSIDSALRQTGLNIEIICVDDGSTDHSAEIIRKIALKDKRVILFQQQNMGAGAARNLAMKEAKGKYIAFLDADDYYWDKNALYLMYQTCEKKKTSVCVSRYMRTMLESGEIRKELVFPEEKEKELLFYKEYQSDYFYTSFLFEKKLLEDKKICFPIYRRYQDPPFLVKALYFSEKIAVCDTCLYCWRDSDVRSKFNSSKTADMLMGMIDNLKFAEENRLDLLFETTTRRLEYEYADIIHENILFDNLKILKLLLEANKIISSKTGKANYVVRPLKMILFSEKQYGDSLVQKIRKQGEVFVYGAGKYARILLTFLKQRGVLESVKNLIVSEMKSNVSQIEGIPVITLQNFLEREKDYIFVAAGGDNKREIEAVLGSKNDIEFEVIEELFFERMSKELYLENSNI